MPNLLLKTIVVVAKSRVPTVVSRSMCHVIIKPAYSRVGTARIVVNHAMPRCFHLNVELEKNGDKDNVDVEHNSDITSNNSTDTVEELSFKKSRNDLINNMSEEELQKHFPDPEVRKRFNLLLLEIEVLRQSGDDIPQQLTVNDIKKLLDSPSKGYKRKCLRYLYLNEMKRDIAPLRRQRKKEEYEQKLNCLHSETTSGLTYGLGHNNMFLRVYNQKMHQSENAKLISALQFEPRLLIDCGYEEYMNVIELDNCVRQLVFAFSENRQNTQPFNLQMCNAHPDGYIIKKLKKYIPQIADDDFPMPINSVSYVDLFDKKELVYLTPHCKSTLVKYDPSKTYIIGAFVDKVKPKNMSSARAKRDGISMMRLPLENYVDWGPGSGKSLAINIMVSIMLDVKNTRDWPTALKHVPRRKLKEYRENSKEQLINNDRFDYGKKGLF